MNSKPTQNPKDNANDAAMTGAIENLIDAQVIFIQQWLREQAQSLTMQAWQWFAEQALNKYVKPKDLQRLINDWLLSQAMHEVVRADIRDILQTLIYHPVNDNVQLSELIDDSQFATLASYIASHEQQRSVLIHTLIGNETFADLMTQMLYHAINGFMESTLDKAGGVGKLMKLGRSSFEKVTNNNLDEKLQSYLNRNIKDLARRAEVNAQQHLSNEEVTRLLITGWGRIKNQPISQLQTYLNNDPDNGSISHIEASVQHTYNRLRMTPYLHSLVAAAIDTWYTTHQSDTIATLAAGLYIDEQAVAQLSDFLLPIAYDALDSGWLTEHIREMLQAFYTQPSIKKALVFNTPYK